MGGWSTYAGINIFFLFLTTGSVQTNQLVSYALLAGFFVVSTHLFRICLIKWGWLTIYITRLLPRMFGAVLVLSIANYLFQVMVSYSFGPLNPEDFDLVSILLNLLSLGILYLSWSLIYFLYHYLSNYSQNLKYEAAMKEMELSNLKSQLNPHFIFNALNSIRALVDEDPQKSKNAITQLSNILRNSLVLDKKRLTRFSEEINTVKDYLALESIRFEERLEVEIDLHPDSDQFEIPPLMIQTLVENGIKHGVSQLKEGGKIVIKTDVGESWMSIRITNSGQIMNGARWKGIGYGIPNTQKRLKLIYGDDAFFNIHNLDGQSVETEIRIPQKVI